MNELSCHGDGRVGQIEGGRHDRELHAKRRLLPARDVQGLGGSHGMVGICSLKGSLSKVYPWRRAVSRRGETMGTGSESLIFSRVLV